jgi:hypothetical protein
MKARIRIAIACAGLLLVSAAEVGAQTTFRETGSVTVGEYIVWVRGTSANVVELYVGRGFRDAFARAHEIDAARLQHWIDSVRAIAPLPSDDSSVVDAHARGSMVGSDVSMMRRVGGPFAGLRLVTGEESITMAESTARDFIAVLDSAAHVARELSPVAAVSPAPTTMVAAAPAQPSAPVVARVAEHAPAPVVAKAPVQLPVAPLGASTAQAPPELVLPHPSEPVILLASRVDIMPLQLPTPVVPPAPASPPPVAPDPPVVSAPIAPAPTPIKPTPIAPVPVAQPPHDSASPEHADAPADKLIHTPLGPFTIPGALLADRDKEAQYCYTQLGLKYNPDLKGEITVKVSVGNDGAAQDAVVTKRSWQGISAGEVESCVRALAHDWTFAANDPSVAGGAKVLTFRFAP